MLSEITSVLLLLTFSFRSSISSVAFAVFAYITYALLRNRYGNGLISYPGPFFASLTNLWRVRDAYANSHKRPTYIQLHKTYGDVVRLGPKSLSFASPAAIEDIYNPKNNMAKSKWYLAFEAHGKGTRKANIFSTSDIHWHARYRTAIKPGFSMQHLAPKEPQIDELISELMNNLDDAALQSKGKATVDLPLNLHYFTFDACGIFAFSRPYGFLQKRSDIDGIIQSTRVGNVHLGPLAQVPILRVLFDKNPLAVYGGFLAPPMAFAKKYLPTQRIVAQLQAQEKPSEHHDILDQYLTAHMDFPGVVTQNEFLDLGIMIVTPASVVVRTAITVCAFHMLKHPSTMAKLQKEIDDVLPDRNSIPSWETVSTRLPYLDACIKESLRIYPSLGFIMERVVPAGGAFIDGCFVPADTVVGCSSWVIHRHTSTFGEDIEVFRPERWLEAIPAQREKMEKFLCPFGFESRLCLGREIGLFEVFKILATLFNRYELTLEEPHADMVMDWGNIMIVDYNVRLKRRFTT